MLTVHCTLYTASAQLTTEDFPPGAGLPHPLYTVCKWTSCITHHTLLTFALTQFLFFVTHAYIHSYSQIFVILLNNFTLVLNIIPVLWLSVPDAYTVTTPTCGAWRNWRPTGASQGLTGASVTPGQRQTSGHWHSAPAPPINWTEEDTPTPCKLSQRYSLETLIMFIMNIWWLSVSLCWAGVTMPLCGETDSQAGKNLLTLNRFQEFLDRFENHEHEF